MRALFLISSKGPPALRVRTPTLHAPAGRAGQQARPAGTARSCRAGDPCARGLYARGPGAAGPVETSGSLCGLCAGDSDSCGGLGASVNGYALRAQSQRRRGQARGQAGGLGPAPRVRCAPRLR